MKPVDYSRPQPQKNSCYQTSGPRYYTCVRTSQTSADFRHQQTVTTGSSVHAKQATTWWSLRTSSFDCWLNSDREQRGGAIEFWCGRRGADLPTVVARTLSTLRAKNFVSWSLPSIDYSDRQSHVSSFIESNSNSNNVNIKKNKIIWSKCSVGLCVCVSVFDPIQK